MNISIIVPCYNLEEHIEKCIISILNQNIGNFLCEVIFVNDCCTDKTEEIIKQNMVKAKNWKWKIVPSTEHSVGGARNVGLGYAVGKYIWFIDGDDWLIDDNSIKTILEEFNQNTKVNMIKFKWESQGFYPKVEYMIWQYVFSKDLIEGLFFSTTMPAEDKDFIIQVKERNPVVRLINIPFYWYNYPRENSVMNLLKKYQLKNINWDKIK